MPSTKLPPVHPGDVLREEFLVPLGITQAQLAKDLHVPASRISKLVRGKSSVSAEMAMRLALYFGNSEQFWLNMQSYHDLELSRDRLGKRLAREVRVRLQT